MPRLTIDDHEVDVPPGSTVLDAARRLGLDIPTLCFLEGHAASTSCMVCLVKVREGDGSVHAPSSFTLPPSSRSPFRVGAGPERSLTVAARFVPSCVTLAVDGMVVESETPEVRRLRRTGLELLLSDHSGECVAPCQQACPAHMDVPVMLRQVEAGDWRAAIATIKKDIALPAVLGRVCSEPCENACRRGDLDSPAAICRIKRHVADMDLASPTPYLPPCEPASGKRVAIVGAGPTGLSAAFHLLQQGHACTLIDDHAKCGGSLRYGQAALGIEGKLPADVLDAEIAVIEKIGARFRTRTRVGRDLSLEEIQKSFDAVLLAVGAVTPAKGKDLSRSGALGQLVADVRTHQTDTPGVFAAGDAVRPAKLAVRSVAEGKSAAVSIDQFLRGQPVVGEGRFFAFRGGRLGPSQPEPRPPNVWHAHACVGMDSQGMATQACTMPRERDRRAPVDDDRRLRGKAQPIGEDFREEAGLCLQCACGARDECRLRRYSQVYGVLAQRFRGERRQVVRRLEHPEIVYEPGKCIVCGLCIEVAAEAKERLGLTFIGRGFDVRVDAPLGSPLADGLEKAARRCAEVCPTGALAVYNSNGWTPAAPRAPEDCPGGEST